MTLETELSAAKTQHEANIVAIKQKHSQRIKNADDNHQRAEVLCNQTRILTGRDPTYARWWIYWPLLLALSTLEVPVNALAFQLYFGDGSLMSMFVTFGIGVVLVVFAHGIGVTMRRFRHNAENFGGALASCGWLVLLFGLTLTICYSLAILRQAYLAFQSAPDPTLSDMIAQGNQLSAAATVLSQNFLQATLQIDGWIFLFINLGIITVGVLASF